MAYLVPGTAAVGLARSRHGAARLLYFGAAALTEHLSAAEWDYWDDGLEERLRILLGVDAKYRGGSKRLAGVPEAAISISCL